MKDAVKLIFLSAWFVLSTIWFSALYFKRDLYISAFHWQKIHKRDFINELLTMESGYAINSESTCKIEATFTDVVGQEYNVTSSYVIRGWGSYTDSVYTTIVRRKESCYYGYEKAPSQHWTKEEHRKIRKILEYVAEHD